MPKYWLDVFQNALDKLNSTEDFQQAMDEPQRLAAATFLYYIEEVQPLGHTEHPFEIGGKSYGGTTVSERLGHTPIQDGYRTVVEKIDGGSSLKISNVSQHIKWIISGAPKHDEPRGFGWLVFWWGEPQRWPAKDRRPAGPRVRGHVDHPGIIPYNFPRIAAESAAGPIEDGYVAGVSGYIRNAMASSGLKAQG